MNTVFTFILVSALIFLTLELFIDNKTYGKSPFFAQQEITESRDNDFINMSTREQTNNGYRPTNIISVDYFSNGKVLNATLWLDSPFKPYPPPNEVDYGIFIDADFDSKTGLGGIDYNVAIEWNKTKQTWDYLIQSWSFYGHQKILVKKNNYTNFYSIGENHVTVSLDLEKIQNPQKYKVLFYADARKIKGGPLIVDSTRWLAIPPLTLNLSTKPNLIELEQGKQKNIEVIVNSTQGYEPIVKIYTINKSKDIDFDLPYSKIRVPSHGTVSTYMSINASKNAPIGPQTLFILANSSFPSEELIKTKTKTNPSNPLSRYASSLPTENIITQSSISINVKEPPDWLTQLGDSWGKVGDFTQFIYGTLAGLSPWILERFRRRKKSTKR